MDTDASSVSDASQDHDPVSEAKRKKVSSAVAAARGSIPPVTAQTPNAARRSKSKKQDPAGDNEKENSLGTLTKRFMDVAGQYPSGLLELNDIATQLGVSKRRMYDITNVLEGINLVEKQSKNVVLWKTGAPLTDDQKTRIAQLRRDVDRSHQLEKKLDGSIAILNSSIRTYTNLPTCYVHHSDVRAVPYLSGRMILAVKAAKGAQVAIEPAPGYQKLTLRSDTEVDVYVLTTDQEPDPAEAENSNSTPATSVAPATPSTSTPSRSQRASRAKPETIASTGSRDGKTSPANTTNGGLANGSAAHSSSSAASVLPEASGGFLVSANSMDATPTLLHGPKREISDPADLLVQIADAASNQAPVPVTSSSASTVTPSGVGGAGGAGGGSGISSSSAESLKSSPISSLLPQSPISPTRGGINLIPMDEQFAFPSFSTSPMRGSPVHKPLPLSAGLLSTGSTPSGLLSSMTSPSADGGSYMDESTQPGMLNHNALRIRSEHSNDTSPFKPTRRINGWGIATPEVSSSGFDDYLEPNASPVKGSFALSPTSSPEKRHFVLPYAMPHDGMESQDGFTFFAESSIGLPTQSHR